MQALRGGDDDERAEHVGEAFLDDERRLVAGERLPALGQLGGARAGEHADSRVEDPVQRGARGRVAKDDVGDALAIELARGGDDVAPERCGDGREPFAPGGDDFACERVGVDDREAAGTQARGDGGLAGGDSACEAEEVHWKRRAPSGTNASREGARSATGVRFPRSPHPPGPPPRRQGGGDVSSVTRFSRRRLFALAGGALVLTSGAVAVVRTRGYVVAEAVAARLEVLAPWQYVVVQAVARRIAAPDREDASIPTTDETDVAGFVDGYVAHLPEGLRRDLLRALAFVEHLAPLGVGCASRFTRLSAGDQDRVLAWLESNDQDLLRAGVRRAQVARLHGLLPRPAHVAHRRLRRPARGAAGRRVVDAVTDADRGARARGGRDAEGRTRSSSARGRGARSRCASSRARGWTSIGARGGRALTRRATSISAKTTCSRACSRTQAGATTKDMAIRVLQGRGVGGSTVHNTNLCKRTPDEILDLWARSTASTGRAPAEMRAAFEPIERDLSVSRDPGSRCATPNNDALRARRGALGWRGRCCSHNRVGCQQ